MKKGRDLGHAYHKIGGYVVTEVGTYDTVPIIDRNNKSPV